MRGLLRVSAGVAALAGALAFAAPNVFAQNAPTPPSPARPTVSPAPPAPVQTTSGEVVQPLPGETDEGPASRAAPRRPQPAAPPVPADVLAGLPTFDELESMSTDEIDALLGLRPRFDIPPAARRSALRVGVIGPDEGGLPSETLARQPAGLVRAALSGLDGPVVSRWGHILLRRALSSRLTAPAGMDPAEFVALRSRALNNLGEYHASRALVQSVDTDDWNSAIDQVAFDAYLATGDVLGMCAPLERGGARTLTGYPRLVQSICDAYEGEVARAQADLNRLRRSSGLPVLDVLLAQRFAAAAGQSRRAFNVEWDGVDALNPWRYSMALAIGEPIPDRLTNGLSLDYSLVAALSPMLPPAERLTHASLAAGQGLLSAEAMVDLYAQVFEAGGDPDGAQPGSSAVLARALRTAYVDNDPAIRLAAIRDIWGAEPPIPYGHQVATAYAAARLPAHPAFADAAAPLIASMLSAGLDRNAMRWADTVETGSEGWAMLAVADPRTSVSIDAGDVEDFIGADDSPGQRKAAFLVAGLAGLGRLDLETAAGLAQDMDTGIVSRTAWARLIDRAAQVRNPGLVALLAGVGMQGTSWERMTPRHLYHIVAGLRRVGLEAEARMIAAEAVARG